MVEAAEESHRGRVSDPKVLEGVESRDEDVVGEAKEKDTEGAARDRVEAPACLAEEGAYNFVCAGHA